MSFERKQFLGPFLDTIPSDTKALPQWVTWKAVPQYDKDGNFRKWDKVPINPKTSRNAKANDPTTWGTYDQAVDFYRRWAGKEHESKDKDGTIKKGAVSGIGLEFAKDGSYVGVDLDHCIRDDGTVEPWAEDVVRDLSSYTEFSPSGSGLHIIVRGKLPPGGRKRGNIEMYSEGRFFTITGKLFAPHLCRIEDRDAEIAEAHSVAFSSNGTKSQKHKSIKREAVGAPTVDEAFILECAPKAKNGTLFSRLWDGDISGHPSASEADQALCNILAFWTQKDAGLMDALFRKSGLMRDKWDEVHRPEDRATYGRMTIETAIAGCRVVYKPTIKKQQGSNNAAGLESDCPLLNEQGKLRKHKKAALALLPHMDNLLYDGVTQRWLRYEENVWRPLTIHQATGIVDRLITGLAPEIDYNTSWRDGVMNQLGLYLSWDDSATPKDAIPFKNGVLFLRDMRFEKHRKDLCFTWQLPYDYNVLATCEPIQKWLFETTGDALQVELLRAYLDAILTGRADLQRYLELIGPGGTGKGTFIRLAEAVIGKENVHVSELKHLENNRFETAKLYGKRLTVITDAEKYSGDVTTLKAMTGEDSLRFEEKHKQNGASFRYQGMVLIAANQDVGSSDYTSGLQRRRITVRFEKVIPPEKRRDLDAEFEPYLPGVINWALSLPRERVTALLRDTDKHVKSLNGASMDMLINVNPIAAWADDCLVYSPEFSKTFIGRKTDEANEKLYPSYCNWCDGTGHQAFAVNRFITILKDLLCNQLRLVAVKHTRDATGKYFDGIGIRKASTDNKPSPLAAYFGVITRGEEKAEPVPNNAGPMPHEMPDKTRTMPNVPNFSQYYSGKNMEDDGRDTPPITPSGVEEKNPGKSENREKFGILGTEPLQTGMGTARPGTDRHEYGIDRGPAPRTDFRVKCADCLLVPNCPTPKIKAEHGTMLVHHCQYFQTKRGAA